MSEFGVIQGKKTGRENLGRPWQPGESGNPKGRPKLEHSNTEILRARLAEHPEIVDYWIQLCLSPDRDVALRAMVAAFNRAEGMPRQSMEVSNPESDPWVMLQRRLLSMLPVPPALPETTEESKSE